MLYVAPPREWEGAERSEGGGVEERSGVKKVD